MDATSYSLGMLDKGIVGHLTLVQPIFAGGQIYNGNQLAKIGTRAAKLQETLAETGIRKNTETYYWLIVSLKEKLKTIDEAQKQGGYPQGCESRSQCWRCRKE